MTWIILFVISWVMFFFIVNYKTLKYNIWAGIFTVILEIMIDYPYTSLNLYKSMNNIIEVGGLSLFYLASVPLVVGTLMAQHYPSKLSYRIANIFVISIIFYGIEFLLLLKGDIIYLNWHWYNSIIINLIGISCISWFIIDIVQRKRENL